MRKQFITVPLTQGYFTVIDAEDAERVLAHSWNLSGPGPYARATIKQKSVYLHRFLMNTPDGFETDHINGHPLDNRKHNLRICTRAQNGANTRRKKANLSGYRGVYFDERNGPRPWVARIGVNCGSKYIGRYATPEEAARAFDEVARALRGEFALTNF